MNVCIHLCIYIYIHCINIYIYIFIITCNSSYLDVHLDIYIRSANNLGAPNSRWDRVQRRCRHCHSPGDWMRSRYCNRTMGEPWENHGKIMGKWWFYGKTMGKSWENGGFMGKPWKNAGLVWFHGAFPWDLW